MKRVIESPKAVSTSFDGLHTIEFNEGSHRYKLDGKACVGTTTFIKEGYPTSQALISWTAGQAATYVWDVLQAGGEPDRDETIKAAKQAHRPVAAAAAAIGTLVHDYAYWTELKRPDEVVKIKETVGVHPDKEKIQNGIDKFVAWRETNEDEIVLSEALIASPLYKYCGKFDRLARRDGRLILSDFKTSGGIYPEMFLQLAAYRIAIKEWLGLDVSGLEILRFGKEDGELHSLLIDDPNEISMFEKQVIRCRETDDFRRIEKDERFAWGGKK